MSDLAIGGEKVGGRWDQWWKKGVYRLGKKKGSFKLATEKREGECIEISRVLYRSLPTQKRLPTAGWGSWADVGAISA